MTDGEERYTSYPFPAYSYVTGKFPHPLRDDDGHGCPGPDEPTSAPTNEDWPTCEMYLWGIDLFNAGFYWEAHEAWEAVWHTAGRRGPTADFLKALIKLAAAGVKARENRPIGVERHGRRALELVTSIFRPPVESKLGLQGNALRSAAHSIVGQAQAIADEAIKDLGAPILPALRPKK